MNLFLVYILLSRDLFMTVDCFNPVLEFRENMKYVQQRKRWQLFLQMIRETRVSIYSDGVWIERRIVPRSGDAPS